MVLRKANIILYSLIKSKDKLLSLISIGILISLLCQFLVLIVILVYDFWLSGIALW